MFEGSKSGSLSDVNVIWLGYTLSYGFLQTVKLNKPVEVEALLKYTCPNLKKRD